MPEVALCVRVYNRKKALWADGDHDYFDRVQAIGLRLDTPDLGAGYRAVARYARRGVCLCLWHTAHLYFRYLWRT